jgi:hypothetical protein
MYLNCLKTLQSWMWSLMGKSRLLPHWKITWCWPIDFIDLTRSVLTDRSIVWPYWPGVNGVKTTLDISSVKHIHFDHTTADLFATLYGCVRQNMVFTTWQDISITDVILMFIATSLGCESCIHVPCLSHCCPHHHLHCHIIVILALIYQLIVNIIFIF